jgi:hypothetical protein
MKFRIKQIIAFVLVLVMFSQPTGVSAAEIFHFKGRSADAIFSSTDPSGCIVTDVFLLITDHLSPPPPGSETDSAGIYLGIFQYNRCTATQLLAASTIAPLSKTDYQIAGNLNSATLQTTVSMFDTVSSTSFDVTVDLTWTGTSERIHQNTHFNDNFEGCHYLLRSNNTYRLAEAVGTVSDGLTNFTSEPSLEGHIGSTMLGSISTGCERLWLERPQG